MLKTLTDELHEENNFAAAIARYELIETHQGAMIYRLRASEANGEPIHYICPVCLNRDKLISYADGNGDYRVCQTNREHVFRFNHTPTPHKTLTVC